MRQIQTKDGSITFHNEEVDETYHSVSGAKEESIEKFARPCKIDRLQKAKVLDVCFGLGYNSAAALDLFKGTSIEITAIEIDPAIIMQIPTIDAPFRSYNAIKKVTVNNFYKDNKISIKLHVDDIRKLLPTLPSNNFDAIFHDPFSPKKVPELWTLPLFRQLFRVTKPGGILATYSCARQVRDNLKDAGFQVQDGPKVGRRAPSTLATKPF